MLICFKCLKDFSISLRDFKNLMLFFELLYLSLNDLEKEIIEDLFFIDKRLKKYFFRKNSFCWKKMISLFLLMVFFFFCKSKIIKVVSVLGFKKFAFI